MRWGGMATPLHRACATQLHARLDDSGALIWLPPNDAIPHHESLRDALVADRIDIAVCPLDHAPAQDPAGTHLACVAWRGDPRDAVVARTPLPLRALPAGARIEAGRTLRAAQLLRLNSAWRVSASLGDPIQRLEALEQGAVDAAIVSCATLERLGHLNGYAQPISHDLLVPSWGQAGVGLLVRREDARATAALARLRDVRAAATVMAERHAAQYLRATRATPLAAHTVMAAGRLRLHLRLVAADGSLCLDTRAEGALGEAAQIGVQAARQLQEAGAAELLDPANS